MARRGRKRNLEKERLYWDLLASGLGTVEACRQAGIGRRTGLRWRRENGGIRPERGRCRTHDVGPVPLLFERERVQTLAAQGAGVREVARRLGRSPSTISRELRRTGDRDAYDAGTAHQHAARLATRHRRSKLSPRTSGCTTSSRASSPSSGARSRSAATCASITPSTRSAPRRSTRACTCPTAAPCAAIWPRASGPDGRCASPAGTRRSAPRATSTPASSSTTAPRRPPTARSLGTGKAT